MSPDTVVPSSLRDPERPSALPELPRALGFTEPLTATSKWTVCTAVMPVALRVMISFGSETGLAVGVPELPLQPTTAIARRTPANARADRLGLSNNESSLRVYSRGNIAVLKGGRQAACRQRSRPPTQSRSSSQEPRARQEPRSRRPRQSRR